MTRPYHLHTRAEDELMYSYRYRCALGRIRALEEIIARMQLLDGALIGVRVSTCGACLPAFGTLVWKGGAYALVWFDGSDAPVAWPLVNIEIAAGAI
jgi:hypothetical protein